jgi:hypothetical protein
MDGDMNDTDTDNDTDTGTDNAQRPAHTRRGALRRFATLTAALAGLVLLAAACSSSPSSPGVAGARGGVTTTTAPAATGANLKPTAAQAAELLAYSHCMQSHGVPDFPDPSSSGALQIAGGPGTDLNPNSPQFKKAQAECQKLMPTATPAQKAQALASGLKMAQCMRAHGITDFPDPNSSGQLQIRISPGSDLDPNNPQFQAAQKACGGHLPKVPRGAGSGNKTTGGGGAQSGLSVGP